MFICSDRDWGMAERAKKSKRPMPLSLSSSQVSEATDSATELPPSVPSVSEYVCQFVGGA